MHRDNKRGETVGGDLCVLVGAVVVVVVLVFICAVVGEVVVAFWLWEIREVGWVRAQ